MPWESFHIAPTSYSHLAIIYGYDLLELFLLACHD